MPPSYKIKLHQSVKFGLQTTEYQCIAKCADYAWNLQAFIVDEARAMLKGTNLTIKQICYELGFPSQSFFGKFFKRITGMSPMKYRQNPI